MGFMTLRTLVLGAITMPLSFLGINAHTLFSPPHDATATVATMESAENRCIATAKPQGRIYFVTCGGFF